MSNSNSYVMVNRGSFSDVGRGSIPPSPIPKSPGGRSSGRRAQSTGRLRAALLATPFVMGAILYFAGKHSEQLVSLRKTQPLASDAYLYATANVKASAYEVHPIHQLIEDAKKEWEHKQARQSTTYEGAVAEYKRRYQRNPPPGFRAWYEWARANDVQMIDEYDSIMESVTPFFSLTPNEIHKRVNVLEKPPMGESSHAILEIRDGEQLPWAGATWRPAISETWDIMLEGIVEYLPDMRVPVFLHDGPMTIMDADAKEAYKQAGREGKLIDEDTLKTAGWSAFTNRERTCPSDSPHRLYSMGLGHRRVVGGPSFVADHVAEMDYCRTPANQELHGSTSADTWLSKLEPSFTMSKTPINGDLLYPAPIQYDLNPENEIPFRDKPEHKIVWRGSPDGIWVSPEMKWRLSHRFRLIYLTTSESDTITRNVRMTKLDRTGREYQIDVNATLAELNERYSNIRPTHEAVQCAEKLCDHVNQVLGFQKKLPLEEMAQHRYVMDVDGNAYSARFRTHLMGNQVPFKATIFPEWYTERIQPWVHYVPIRTDYSDLYNVLAFFDGGLDSERTGNHDDLAEEIAIAGAQWAATHWRIIDMRSYMFRLLLEFGRLLSEKERTPIGTGL